MLKKIIKLLTIYILFFTSWVFADFVICDSGNINYNWKTISEICNNWYESLDISIIESFTWNYINYDLWFWWTDFNVDFENNVEWNFPIWFFDWNKETQIKNINPEYNFITWYIWTANSFSDVIIDLDNNYVIWFFDENKNTVTLNTDSNYSFPIWYLWNHKIKKKSSWGWNIVIQNDITYEEYFKEIFIKNINLIYFYKYSEYELEKFTDNLVDLLLEKDSEVIISDVIKRRINLHIENSNFRIYLNQLLENLDDINNAFESTYNRNEKIYILDYFKN